MVPVFRGHVKQTNVYIHKVALKNGADDLPNAVYQRVGSEADDLQVDDLQVDAGGHKRTNIKRIYLCYYTTNKVVGILAIICSKLNSVKKSSFDG